MDLNSFCVIVTKDGLRVYWKRPERLNDAIKTYRRLQRQYGYDFPVIFDDNSMDDIQVSRSLNDVYSDEWIQERIRMWQGNTQIISQIVVNLGWSLDDGKGTQIELLHSSRA